MHSHNQHTQSPLEQRIGDSESEHKGIERKAPPFQLTAAPIQRDEDESAESTTGGSLSLPGFTPQQYSLGIPQLRLQLRPLVLDPVWEIMEQERQAIDWAQIMQLSERERELALIERLRRRTPLVGSVLPESWILGMWRIGPFDTIDGPDGPQRTYDLLDGEGMDEQMLINRIMARDHPDPLGWRPSLNDQGFGLSHLWESGTEFNLGVLPGFETYISGGMSLSF